MRDYRARLVLDIDDSALRAGFRGEGANGAPGAAAPAGTSKIEAVQSVAVNGGGMGISAGLTEAAVTGGIISESVKSTAESESDIRKSMGAFYTPKSIKDTMQNMGGTGYNLGAIGGGPFGGVGKGKTALEQLADAVDEQKAAKSLPTEARVADGRSKTKGGGFWAGGWGKLAKGYLTWQFAKKIVGLGGDVMDAFGGYDPEIAKTQGRWIQYKENWKYNVSSNPIFRNIASGWDYGWEFMGNVARWWLDPKYQFQAPDWNPNMSNPAGFVAAQSKASPYTNAGPQNQLPAQQAAAFRMAIAPQVQNNPQIFAGVQATIQNKQAIEDAVRDMEAKLLQEYNAAGVEARMWVDWMQGLAYHQLL